jgi:hypothetical protein
MPLVDDFLIAGGRDDKVGVAGRLDHGHDAETVHDRFKGAQWLDLGQDHVGSWPRALMAMPLPHQP